MLNCTTNIHQQNPEHEKPQVKQSNSSTDKMGGKRHGEGFCILKET